MPAPRAAHATKSDLELALCDELTRQKVPHAHRSLHFRVRLASGEEVRYDPDVVVHRGPILFLIEAVVSDSAETVEIEIMTRFLDQHSPEIVLIAVVPQALVQKLPPASYDEIYADADIEAVVRRIRDQDPEGIVEPFMKPRPP